MILSKIIQIFHIIIIFYIIFGFLTPYPYLWIHFFYLIIILIQWIIYNNRCILTDLDVYINEGTIIDDNNNYSLMNIFYKKIGIELSEKQLIVISYIGIHIMLLITSYRIYNNIK
jgi:hypothetical protein